MFNSLSQTKVKFLFTNPGLYLAAMSSPSDRPIAVTVSAYPQAEAGGDGATVNVHAMEVESSPITVVAAPVQNHTQVAYARPVNTPSIVLGVNNPYANTISENLIRVASLARSLKCLTAVDAIIVLIFAIVAPLVLILLIGPICGYVGASRFKIGFMYAYAVYWGFRFIIDLLFISSGLWWFIISLIVDAYILRYIYVFVTQMKALTPEELGLLVDSDPNEARISGGRTTLAAV